MEDIDVSKSTLQLLAVQGIKNWGAKALLSLLLDDDPIVRTLAAHELQVKGIKDGDLVFEKIVEMLKSPIDYVREIAVYILGQFGTKHKPYKHKRSILLHSMVNDGCSDVRTAAIAGLGHLYDNAIMPEEIVNTIISYASDDSPDVRVSVCYALGNAKKNDIVKNVLEKLNNDPDEEVCSWAELGLELLEIHD